MAAGVRGRAVDGMEFRGILFLNVAGLGFAWITVYEIMQMEN